jgi:DHA2 family multidrug resistance protein
MISTFHADLVEHVTPFNDGLRLPDAAILAGRSLANLATLDGLVTQQAAMMAYSNDFLLLTFVSLAAFPLLVLIRSSKAKAAAPTGTRAHAVMD